MAFYKNTAWFFAARILDVVLRGQYKFQKFVCTKYMGNDDVPKKSNENENEFVEILCVNCFNLNSWYLPFPLSIYFGKW